MITYTWTTDVKQTSQMHVLNKNKTDLKDGHLIFKNSCQCFNTDHCPDFAKAGVTRSRCNIYVSRNFLDDDIKNWLILY